MLLLSRQWGGCLTGTRHHSHTRPKRPPTQEPPAHVTLRSCMLVPARTTSFCGVYDSSDLKSRYTCTSCARRQGAGAQVGGSRSSTLVPSMWQGCRCPSHRYLHRSLKLYVDEVGLLAVRPARQGVRVPGGQHVRQRRRSRRMPARRDWQDYVDRGLTARTCRSCRHAAVLLRCPALRCSRTTRLRPRSLLFASSAGRHEQVQWLAVVPQIAGSRMARHAGGQGEGC